MPYFERTDSEPYARRFVSSGEERHDEDEEAFYEEEEVYAGDDGFDALMEDPEEESEPDPEEARMLAEEDRQSRLHKLRIAAGVGDLGAVVVGVAVILLLVAFLISMIRFVSSDFNHFFSLWRIKL